VDEDEDRLRYKGWRVAAASAAGVFLATVAVYTFPVLMKPLSDEFSWSRQQISLAFGLLAMMSAVSAAPIGYLLDRLGARSVVLPCLLLLSCAFGSLSLLTGRLWQLYATYALLGIAVTGLSPLAYGRVVSTWFERRRGLALGLVISGASIGAICLPPTMHALIGAVGWRFACASLGGAALIAGLLAVVPFVRPRGDTMSAQPAQHADGSLPAAGSVRQALRTRVFWILIAVVICVSVTQSGTTIHLVALLTDRGIAAHQAALALSVLGAASMTGRLLTGWLIDRFFAARVSFVVLMMVAAGAVLLSGARSFALGIVAAILIGFGMGGEFDVTPYLLSRYFGLRSFSTLYGFAWMATASATALGPILMGRAFDLTGSYESLLTWLAAITAGAALLMLTLPRPSTPCSITASQA